MPVPGGDTYIIDDSTSGASATATDTMYLLSTAGPAKPTITKKADTEDDTLNAQLRAYFEDGGKSVVLQGYAASGELPILEAALGLLPSGPGQVVCPEAVASADLIKIAKLSWAANKVSLLNGPSTATDSQLETLAAAVIAGCDARGAAIFADYGLCKPPTGEVNEKIPWAVTVAALIARNDLLTGNPGLAPAGKQGITAWPVGLDKERTDAVRETFDGKQINTAKTVTRSLRNYGYRTLADLETLPDWWDMSGSRTIMAFRAQVAAIDEEFVFGDIDGEGIYLGRYESAIRTIAKAMWEKKALYGASPDDAYRVIVQDDEVNPIESLAKGEVKARVYLKTSRYANHLVTDITRRGLSVSV